MTAKQLKTAKNILQRTLELHTEQYNKTITKYYETKEDHYWEIAQAINHAIFAYQHSLKLLGTIISIDEGENGTLFIAEVREVRTTQVTYKIIDADNQDTVYKGPSKAKAYKAFCEYDDCCEGEWIPDITIIDFMGVEHFATVNEIL